MKAIVNYFPNPSPSDGHRQLQRVLSDKDADSVISKYSGDEGKLSTWLADGWRIDSTAGYTGQGPQLALTLVLVREDLFARR